ncbi:unnamed protein product [Amoebophrya sp. A120]|nr:unnamed protein product [Amoebophrya sp. A120]|eukprot:GSA120T00001799001.1
MYLAFRVKDIYSIAGFFRKRLKRKKKVRIQIMVIRIYREQYLHACHINHLKKGCTCSIYYRRKF